MVEWKDAQLTSPHGHIKTTATYRTVITEIDLKTGRWLFYSQGCKEQSTQGLEGREEKQSS